MALDAVGEVFGGVLRFFGRMVAEVLFQGLLYGTGYVLLKPFHRDKEPSDTLCGVVGLLAWAAFAAVAYMAYRYVQSPA
ncbi:hypothetical protein [Lysobacter capsici]|uniref:hypothetical protein n=1 Tax=Lysobacter capsici TaxID=435897 RepID=UPI001C003E48|nr:hypothetical protein [Lysobacter capsici]QWF15667.1 hypothetical protein KME82_18015 [Lysobacter capsici]